MTLVRVVAHAEEGPAAERYLEEHTSRVRAAGVSCAWSVRAGDPAQAIVVVAEPDKLVAMATHGRSGITRGALGSVADRVARGGAAAVLAFRPGATQTA